MLWSKSRLSHHITRMQRRGLVLREECEDDGRGAVIALTERGRARHGASAHHPTSRPSAATSSTC